MIRRLVRLARRRLGVVAAGVLVAAGALAALPASASASSSGFATAVVNFGTLSSPDNLYSSINCTVPDDYFYPANVVQVYNPCGDRIWVHYTDGSTVHAYCVNPGGAIAYHLPIPYASGDLVDIQITGSANQCDTEFTVDWVPPLCDPWQGLQCATSDDYGCEMGIPQTLSGYKAGAIPSDGCDFRIWLHQNSSGPVGQQLCLNPGQTWNTGTNVVYEQVEGTYNQSPCDAGSSPYPPT